jgi:UDP:flavonoid glycosyltransferase YjiC (YdhE family)
MRIFAVTLGSIGDLMPFIAVASALSARGHDIVFASNDGYETLVRAAGFEFRAVWTRDSVRQSLDDVLESDPGEAWNRVRRDMFAASEKPVFDAVADAARHGPCVLLAAWSASGALRAHQTLRLPLCRVYLSPRPLLDDGIAPDSRAAPRRSVAFFPDWFLAGAPPPGVAMTGFPMFEDASLPALPRELERFLAEGERPVVFTPGSFARNAGGFFRESLSACRAMRMRAVLLTPYGEQVPSPLPPWAIHFKYVALQRLLPRTAALVSHGGIGTCAQGLRAAIPQLAVPVFFDQADNAARIEALGVGAQIAPAAYRAGPVAERLAALLRSEAVRRQCALIGARLRAESPVGNICDMIETLG